MLFCFALHDDKYLNVYIEQASTFCSFDCELYATPRFFLLSFFSRMHELSIYLVVIIKKREKKASSFKCLTKRRTKSTKLGIEHQPVSCKTIEMGSFYFKIVFVAPIALTMSFTTYRRFRFHFACEPCDEQQHSTMKHTHENSHEPSTKIKYFVYKSISFANRLHVSQWY